MHDLSHPERAPRPPIQRFHQMAAQRRCGLGLTGRPGFTAAPHGFPPPLERFAGAQPYLVPFGDRDGLVVGVPTPIHRPEHLTPEPGHVLTVGQVEHQRAGGHGRIQVHVGQLVGQPVGGGDLVVSDARPRDDVLDRVLCGHHAACHGLPLEFDDDTIGGYQVEQARRVEQRRDQRGVVVERRDDQLAQDLLRGQPSLQLVFLVLVDQTQRQRRAQELGGGSAAERRQVRTRIMVARDEPPQPSVPQQRDRHRGAHTHVLQVLDVDR